MSNIQLIFCLESKGKDESDKIYVMETLRRYGLDRSGIKIRYEFMSGKNGYVTPHFKRKIKKYTDDFGKQGKTQQSTDKVIGSSKTYEIYCIDTDNYESDAVHKDELKKIEEHCKSGNKRLIWFCHDIEEVYLGKSIEDSEKTKEAKKFMRSKLIDSVDENKLSASNDSHKTTGKSNILTVLQEFRK